MENKRADAFAPALFAIISVNLLALADELSVCYG